MRVRAALPYIFLLAVSTAVTLLASELVVRWMHHAWPFERALFVPPHLTEKDRDLRWRFSPGGERNSLGLRDTEIRDKKPWQCRILVLGDSLVYSGETASGALYTEIVEKGLNRQAETLGHEVDVINAGVPGFTTYQELEFLKLYGLDMEPDVVVLGFVWNDLYYKYLHRPTKERFLAWDPDAYLYRIDSHHPVGRLLAWSHLGNEVAHLIERAVNKLDRIRNGENGHPFFPFEYRLDFYAAWKPHPWERAEAMLAEMTALLGQRSVPLLVVAFPIANQLDERYRRTKLEYLLFPQRRLRAMATRLSTPLLDLTPALHAGGGASLYRDFLHLGPRGNEIVASELEAFLLETHGVWGGRCRSRSTRAGTRHRVESGGLVVAPSG